jgi:hypothetical protein
VTLKPIFRSSPFVKLVRFLRLTAAVTDFLHESMLPLIRTVHANPYRRRRSGSAGCPATARPW